MQREMTAKGADGLYRSATDKPIAALQKQSAEAGKANGVPFNVLPKFTCEKCGERNFAGEPDVWPEAVTCKACGHSQPFTRGGYAMRFRFNETPDNANLPPKIVIGLPPDMAGSKADAESNSKRVASAFGIEMDKVEPMTAADKAEVLEMIRKGAANVSSK